MLLTIVCNASSCSKGGVAMHASGFALRQEAQQGLSQPMTGGLPYAPSPGACTVAPRKPKD